MSREIDDGSRGKFSKVILLKIMTAELTWLLKRDVSFLQAFPRAKNSACKEKSE